MSWIPLLLTASLSASPAAAGESDWRELLAMDQVAVRDGKMVSESFSFCKISPPGGNEKSVQLRMYTEAPTDAGISRDFIVSFNAMIQTTFSIVIAQRAAGDHFDFDHFNCHHIHAPIGAVDLDINTYMTEEGYQLELKDGDGSSVSRTTALWKDTLQD